MMREDTIKYARMFIAIVNMRKFFLVRLITYKSRPAKRFVRVDTPVEEELTLMKGIEN